MTTQDRGTKIPLDTADIASMLLSPEKVKEREELIAQGFPSWNRSHYYSFLDGMAIYGRDRLELVAPMVSGRGGREGTGEKRSVCCAVAFFSLYVWLLLCPVRAPLYLRCLTSSDAQHSRLLQLQRQMSSPCR